MLEPPSPSVCLNCLSHPGLLGGGGGGGSGPLGRWSFRGPGQETPAAVAAAEDTPKRNAAHSRATGSLPLPDLSQQEVSGFSRNHTRSRARAPTGARVHPRGHTALPRQAGQVSRGHQQVGEVPPSGSRGPRASLLRGPTNTGVRDQPLDSKSRDRSVSTRPPGEQRPCASTDGLPGAENSVCHKAGPPRSERTNSRVLEASWRKTFGAGVCVGGGDGRGHAK